jgi:hypothetical protein
MAHGMRLLRGYEAWKAERNGASKKFVEEGGLLPYVLFHSFSHMLITEVSLECGYAPEQTTTEASKTSKK